MLIVHNKNTHPRLESVNKANTNRNKTNRRMIRAQHSFLGNWQSNTSSSAKEQQGHTRPNCPDGATFTGTGKGRWEAQGKPRVKWDVKPPAGGQPPGFCSANHL